MSFLLNPFIHGGEPAEPAAWHIASMKFTGTAGSPTTVDLTSLLDENSDPVTLSENDFLLINFGVASTANLSMTPPTGWLEADEAQAGHNADAQQAVWYRTVPAEGLASVEIPAHGNSGDGVGGTVHAFAYAGDYGIHLTQPLDNTTTVTEISNSSEFVPNCLGGFYTPDSIFMACGVGASTGGSSGSSLTNSASLDPQHFQNAVGVGSGSARTVSVVTGIKAAVPGGTFNPTSFGGTSDFGDSNTSISVGLRHKSVGTVGSYDFDGSNDYMERAVAAVAGVPCTFAAWMLPDDIAAASEIVASVGSATTQSRIQMDIQPAGVMRMATVDAASGTGIATTGTYVGLTRWQHVCGKCTSTTSRQMFYDGVGGTENTTSNSPGTFGTGRTNIGCRTAAGARGLFFSGRIAHVAIWNIALSDSDIALLAGGENPQNIQPANLVFYVPLNESGATTDLISGGAMTVSGPVFSLVGPVVNDT